MGWFAAADLALSGGQYGLYFLLSAAVQMGGIAMTSLIIGSAGLAVTIIGRDR
jgi:hypothetical protein